MEPQDLTPNNVLEHILMPTAREQDILEPATLDREEQEIPWGRPNIIDGAETVFEIFSGKQKDLEQIKATTPYLLIGYFLSRCGHCRREIKNLFEDPATVNKLNICGARRIYMDADRYPLLDREFGVPLILAFRQGREIGELRGEVPNSEFLQFVNRMFPNKDSYDLTQRNLHSLRSSTELLNRKRMNMVD